MGEMDPKMIDIMAEFINNPGLVIIGSLISSLIMNSIFSTLGGFVTATIINRKRKNLEISEQK